MRQVFTFATLLSMVFCVAVGGYMALAQIALWGLPILVALGFALLALWNVYLDEQASK